MNPYLLMFIGGLIMLTVQVVGILMLMRKTEDDDTPLIEMSSDGKKWTSRIIN